MFGFGRSALVAALAALSFAAPAAAADPVNIRIGWSTMPGHLIPVLYSKGDYALHKTDGRKGR